MDQIQQFLESALGEVLYFHKHGRSLAIVDLPPSANVEKALDHLQEMFPGFSFSVAGTSVMIEWA
jgi:hypothetical protein